MDAKKTVKKKNSKMFYQDLNRKYEAAELFSASIIIRNVFEHQINIIKLFPKDHVTLKTCNDSENSALPSQELITFKTESTVKLNLYFTIFQFVLYFQANKCSHLFLTGLCV